jgi:hypothetical protein
MGIKQFFNKAGQGLKKFFGKDGTLESTFKKGGSAEKLVNKIGAGIDTGLKAVGNVAGKVANVAGDLAPVLGMVNPELGAGLLAVKGIAGQAGAGVRKAQDIKKTAVGAFKKPLNQVGNMAMSAGPSIMAPKPDVEDGIGLSGMAGINFA